MQAGNPQENQTEHAPEEKERYEVLEQLEEWLEFPVFVLGFVWLVLLIIEFVWGSNRILEAGVYIIWAIFVLDFSVRLLLAPHKVQYLRRNWLTVLSLVLPALRVVRVARVVRLLRLTRTARGLRLVRVVGSLNRGMRALRAAMRRRGFGYVTLLTLIVAFVGAAGMFAFEGGETPGFDSYGDALWWTAMVMTTLGSEFWPRTLEGRFLGFLLSLYAFAVFGYVTATLATFFIGREAANEEAEIAGASAIEGLQAEVQALRVEIQRLVEKEQHTGGGS